MSDTPRVILSGFADEAANQKTAVQQFAAFAALGLQYYSLRFIDVGGGVKNVMKLSLAEIRKVRLLQDEYGLNVSSIGSPIGKVKLLDVEDGTKNVYVPFKKYLAQDVAKVCELAHAFEAKLIRGFSFYPPKDDDPWNYVSQAVDRLGAIAEVCHRADLTFGLEIEANLVGRTGQLLAEIHRQVNHPDMVLVFDAANVLAQGFSPAETYEQYLAMRQGLGWFHIKNYHAPENGSAGRKGKKSSPPTKKGGHVDEESMWHFVPADQGQGCHEVILRDFSRLLPSLEKKLRRRGIPGVFLDMEPHLKGGGQFGGFSGPDGMGVAVRALCRVLDYVGIEYHLRDFADIQAARGF
ncbi:MAG: sugar phosphate isomerase/epimerase [Pirellulales bacterium]|nr:sugar phosphate isomerase/epimerase [Pirellulales bacterium]